MTTEGAPRELPLLAVTGPSGAGKTTLVTALLPRFREAGLRVAAVKQARADFEVDRQGKDSWRLRKAGAAVTIVASGRRWAMMVEEPEDGGRPDLRRLLAQLHAERLDLVLLEGFGHEPVPRIDVRRHPVGAPPPACEDAWLVAVATDRPAELVASVPVLDLDDACEIEGFVLGWLRRQHLGVRGQGPAARVTRRCPRNAPGCHSPKLDERGRAGGAGSAELEWAGGAEALARPIRTTPTSRSS